MQPQLYTQQQVTLSCLPLSVLLNPQCFGEGILPVGLCNVQTQTQVGFLLGTPRPFLPPYSDPHGHILPVADPFTNC